MKSPSPNADTAPVPHSSEEQPEPRMMRAEQNRPKSDFVARVRGALIEASLKEGARFLAGLPVRLGRIVFRWVESGAADFLPLP